MNLSVCTFGLLATATLGVDASYDKISNQYKCFRSMEGMMESMNDLARDHPSLVTISDIGDSYLKNNEGRQIDGYSIPDGGYDIYAIKVTAPGAGSSNDKGKMLITSGVHAREWAPPELLGRFVEMLVRGYDDDDADADITWVL